MSCQIEASGAIELYFYGELAPARDGEIKAHVQACPECRRALADLATIRAALLTRPSVSAPPGSDWSAFMARLDASVRQESEVPRLVPMRAPDPRTAAPLRISVVPYLAMAALLALAVVSSMFLLRARDTGEFTADTPDLAEASRRAEAPIDPALVSLSDQHFERSKLVLLGLATRDPSQPAPGEWEYERELAATLLGDTRLYRRAAEQRGMESLAGVMRDLELVLLQASMADAADAESLGQLQRLIRRRDLLTKMNTSYVAQP